MGKKVFSYYGRVGVFNLEAEEEREGKEREI